MGRPEVRLIQKSKEIRDQAAPDDYVNKYMRLALYIAGTYRKRAAKLAIPWEDIQGTALLALVEAGNSFPNSKAAARGIPFKAYMSTAIKYEMSDLFQKAPIAHLPSKPIYNGVRSLTIAAAKLQSELEKEWVTDEELARDLDWPLEKVRTYQRYARALSDYVEFGRPIVGAEGEVATFGEALPGDVDIEGEITEQIHLEQEKQWLSEATAELPHLTRTAIFLVFGLPAPEGVPKPTFEEVITTVLNPSANASRGVRYLREARQNEQGDMPELGRRDTSIRFSGRKSPTVVTDKEAQHRALNFWRSSAGGGQRPPALRDQPARALGN